MGEEAMSELKDVVPRLVKHLDADEDGSISAQELKDILLACAPEGQKSEVDEMVPMLMSMLGGNATQKVKTEEVVSFLTKGPKEEDPKDKYKMMFRMVDVDGNGSLSSKEMAMFMNMDDPFMEGMLRMMMSEVDEDGDGKLSYDEFCKWMDSKDKP